MALAGPIEIKTVMVIKMNDLHWMPKVKEVHGTPFIMINKWDRHFTQFFTGKALDLRKGRHQSINSSSAGSYLDLLIERRKEASIAAATEMFARSEETSAKSKKRKITNQDEALVPIVQVELPAIDAAGVQVQARTIKMAFCKSGTDLWVEATPDAVQHILLGMRHHAGTHGRSKKKCEEVAELPVVPLVSPSKVHKGMKYLESVCNSQKYHFLSDRVKAQFAA